MHTSLTRTQNGAIPGQIHQASRPTQGDHKGDWICLSHIPGLNLTAKWQRPMERRGELLSPSLEEYRPPIAIGSRAGVDQLKV